MDEYIVVHDKDKEIAAIVNATKHMAFGPAMIGPNAATLLEGWLNTIPYDISEVTSFTLNDWFQQYVQAVGSKDTQAPTTPTAGVVDSPGYTEVVGAAAAEREAVAESATPPEPAPHDTDMEGNQSQADTVASGTQPATQSVQEEHVTAPTEPGPCWNCQGQRMVPGPNGPITCGVCKGTGQLPVPDAATG